MAKNDKSKVKVVKQKTSLRERNIKAAEAKDKPKRIRKVASTAIKPVGKIGSALKTEFHIIPQKKNPGFFTKSRKITPKYFSDSFRELKNVTWPGRKETWKLVSAVFLFAVSIGIFIALLDYVLEIIFKKIVL
jgi:preprotein translocase SecE subunit